MKQQSSYLSFLLFIFLFTFSSCNKLDFLDNLKDLFNKNDHPNGFVYTMTNEAAQNSIVSYMQLANGQLSYKATTASGGTGSGSGLGSQGSLVLNKNHEWLFAVNAGNNTISSFKVGKDGSLTLAHTVSSNGTQPISLTIYGSWLYVVNAVSANISGFTIGAGGTMTLIPGSSRPLSAANAGPAQISFKPDGRFLVVSEKATNKLTVYVVDAFGVAGALNSQTTAGQTPFGFDFSGPHHAVVTEAWGGTPAASTLSSYLVATGSATLASGPVATKQTAVCWIDITKDGKYGFATNTGSNTISSCILNGSGMLVSVNNVAETTDKTPIDVTLSGNEAFVYNVNSVSHTITEFKRYDNSKLQRIGEISVPDHAVGITAF